MPRSTLPPSSNVKKLSHLQILFQCHLGNLLVTLKLFAWSLMSKKYHPKTDHL